MALVYYVLTLNMCGTIFSILIWCLCLNLWTDICLLDASASIAITQPSTTCSKLTLETLEQGLKYVQS